MDGHRTDRQRLSSKADRSPRRIRGNALGQEQEVSLCGGHTAFYPQYELIMQRPRKEPLSMKAQAVFHHARVIALDFRLYMVFPHGLCKALHHIFLVDEDTLSKIHGACVERGQIRPQFQRLEPHFFRKLHAGGGQIDENITFVPDPLHSLLEAGKVHGASSLLIPHMDVRDAGAGQIALVHFFRDLLRGNRKVGTFAQRCSASCGRYGNNQFFHGSLLRRRPSV